MKVYIAGPMTGLPRFNRPAFHLAAEKLTFAKHVALNPAILPDFLTEADYMAIALTMLQRAEAIYLLSGWENSAGAKVEHALALKLGLQVFNEDQHSDLDANLRTGRKG